MPTPSNLPRLLFLYSDTGGGHRSAVEAIIEALNLEFPAQFAAEKVDFSDFTPHPRSDMRRKFTRSSQKTRACGE